MTRSTVIVDYGIGNLLSVARAVEACDGAPAITGDHETIRSADRLILPGVGAFGRCMDELRQRGLNEPVTGAIEAGAAALGICVGMQLLLETSSEFGSHRGLGLVAGTVDAIPPIGDDGTPTKVPHVGWSALHPARSWSGTILDGVSPGRYCYFVHSFAAQPQNREARLADVEVGSRSLVAAIQTGNLCGTQFHPEKSGAVGLAILRNFLKLERTPAATREPMAMDAHGA